MTVGLAVCLMLHTEKTKGGSFRLPLTAQEDTLQRVLPRPVKPGYTFSYRKRVLIGVVPINIPFNMRI